MGLATDSSSQLGVKSTGCALTPTMSGLLLLQAKGLWLIIIFMSVRLVTEWEWPWLLCSTRLCTPRSQGISKGTHSRRSGPETSHSSVTGPQAKPTLRKKAALHCNALLSGEETRHYWAFLLGLLNSGYNPEWLKLLHKQLKNFKKKINGPNTIMTVKLNFT